jgi:hypothetical protein
MAGAKKQSSRRRVPATKAEKPASNGNADAGLRQALAEQQALTQRVLGERDEAMLEVGRLTIEKNRLESVRAQLEQQLALALNDPDGVRALIEQATAEATAGASGDSSTT